MIKMKGLGRGLDALLAGSDARAEDELRSLPVDRLKPGKYQPRTHMDQASLAELAASIKAQGVMQPILVRAIDSTPGAERYEIVAGERRWRAAQLAGLSEVPGAGTSHSRRASAGNGTHREHPARKSQPA